MSIKDKEYLLNILAEAHLAIRATLDEVDLEMPVHKDSSWRVREIIGHIATWDQEVANSLRAYQAGSAYQISDLDEEETEYNEKAILEQKKLSVQQIVAEWERAHDEFRKAIQEMPSDRFPGDMQYPWDERGSIANLVEEMVEHAIEHRDEIVKAQQAI